MESNKQTVRLSPADNVVIACQDLARAADIVDERIVAGQAIARGHKVATAPIGVGDPIRKYGQIIGFAASEIAPGDHVHTHNCAFHAVDRGYEFSTELRDFPEVPAHERATFEGFRRSSGRVGTRNYLGILTTVNCSATVARYIAEEVNRGDLLKDNPNVDGVVALVHNTGCGMADNGEGFGNLQRTLWGFARHPNFAGVLMVGLGCEVNQIPFLLDAYGLEIGDSLQTMTIQETGGTRKAVAAGVGRVAEMLPAAGKARRERVPVSELTMALQCGGSDAYSGLTANPALGAAADRLVQHGGTAILSETTEIYGAEHLLTQRAISREVGEKLLERVRWWEDYTARNGASMNNNPSPGNKAGGLTTILEKSLGAVAKGGTSNLMGVFKYAEPIDTKGFVFMDSPGFDPASITGQVAAGANVVCFTTGRGSVYGCKPAPSIKIATNTPMFKRMSDDMDVNCGEIVAGEASIEEKGAEIFQLVLDVASGHKKTRSESHGFGDHEFVPWQIGATI